MTDIKRLEELQTEIHRLEAILKPMYEERKELNKKIKADNKASLPYNLDTGVWFEGKTEKLYLYFNRKDKTYHTKPLYKANGYLYGCKTTKSHITQMTTELQAEGYIEIK